MRGFRVNVVYVACLRGKRSRAKPSNRVEIVLAVLLFGAAVYSLLSILAAWRYLSAHPAELRLLASRSAS